jgi:thiamine-phosphate pyrophosphorylase
VPGVFAAGADSAAVVTDILSNPDPESKTKQWLDVTRVLA